MREHTVSASSGKKVKRPLFLLLGVILVAAVIFTVLRLNNGIESDTYQLVRLDNGESYIGRLSGLDDKYASLAMPLIYKEPAGGQAATDKNEIQLLRVSSVNGDLRIATDKIIYWGNLPKEGKVVNAIKSADK